MLKNLKAGCLLKESFINLKLIMSVTLDKTVDIDFGRSQSLYEVSSGQ